VFFFVLTGVDSPFGNYSTFRWPYFRLESKVSIPSDEQHQMDMNGAAEWNTKIALITRRQPRTRPQAWRCTSRLKGLTIVGTFRNQ